VRRAALPLVIALVLAGSAAAAAIRGTDRADVLLGSAAADRIDALGGNDRVMAAFGGRDRVACGRGRDLAVADGSDTVARDCETVVRRLSVDPFRDLTSQHETAVEPSNAAFGSTVVATFQVGRFTDGGASGTGFAVSRDAGRTWRQGVVPGLGRSSDPVVAYDAVHATWLISALSIVSRQVGVVVSRSADGLHWSAPITPHPGPDLDKEWIACDNSAASAFRGRCYLVVTDIASHRVISQSSDDGGVTWSAPVRVSSELIGVLPLIRPDGSLVVLAIDVDRSGGSVVTARSTNGGASFETARRISDIQFRSLSPLRSFPLPSAVASPDGTLYTMWHDCRFRSGCGHHDIVLSRSTDGVSWSAPQRLPLVAAGSDVDTFLPGLGVDPADPSRLGLVYGFFRAGSCARGSCQLGFGFASSRDSGQTWSTPLRLDAIPMPLTWLPNTRDGRMAGDYFAVSFAAGRAVPVFALAAPPHGGRFREGIFATSLPG
jgi:hypothetical protein